MEVKVGDRVRVRGDRSDFTEHLDGEIGTVRVNDLCGRGDVVVEFDAYRGVTFDIWRYNIVEVIKSGS